MKQIPFLLVLLILNSCSKSENSEALPIPISEESQKEDTNDDETPTPTGTLLFTIKIPANSIRKDIDKLHFVLYDANNEVLAHRTHSSGQAESLGFYGEFELQDDTKYSLSHINNFQESVFNIRLYMDLTGKQLKNGIEFQDNATDRRTNLLDIPITSIEEGHSFWAQGSGYSLNGYSGNFSGHFSSDYANSLGTEQVFIQYFAEDGISDYKYLFIPLQTLNEMDGLDASIFEDDATRYRYVNFYKPFSRTLIRIIGFDDEPRFNANVGHTVHASNYLSDYGGARYSYADFFHAYLSSVQLDNYEVQQVGLPPEDLEVPELDVDYEYNEGLISFRGIPDYESSRFLLRSSGAIHVTTVIVADGNRTEIIIPEVPEDLFDPLVMEGLKVSLLSIQQGAAENYAGYETYADYISNTLLFDKPYYLSAPKRERVFKSSVGPQLLPF